MKLGKQIELFWKGKLSLKERGQLYSRLAHTDGISKEEILDGAQSPLAAQGIEVSDELWFSKMLGILNVRIDAFEHSRIRQKRVRMTRIRIWSTVAAAMLLGIFFSISEMINQHASPSSDSRALAIISKENANWLIVQNESDTIRCVTMKDGSKLYLQPHTVLRYSRHYGLTSRQIDLMSGEVNFNVAKDKKRPFIVSAGRSSTMALGTSFSVLLGPVCEANIHLTQGSVKVSSWDNQNKPLAHVILKPGEKVRVGTSGQIEVVRPGVSLKFPHEKEKAKSVQIVAAPDLSGLDFNNQSLDQVFKRLGGMYTTKIIYDTAGMKQLWFSGSFDRSDSIQQMVSVICRMNKLGWRQAGDSIIIK